MPHPHETEGEAPVLNVLQVVALSFASAAGLLAGLSALGFTWGVAVVIAFVASPVPTLCLSAAILWWKTRRSESGSRDDYAEAPALVSPDIRETRQVWEEDLLLEIDHATKIIARDPDAQPRRRSSDRMIDMWEEDAAAESRDAEAALGRPQPAARRRSGQ